MKKTEAIKSFLMEYAQNDLANLYDYSMEVQVNVAQDEGKRIEGSFKGKKWHGWSDGVTTWKAIRIPFKADTDPVFEDTEIRFDLECHVEAIGMTGWDWLNRVSKWVAFDFDSILTHPTTGLSSVDLQTVCDTLSNVDWVTIRRSTSGSGYHMYVFVPDVPTANHKEHQALARSILWKLAGLTGVDFQSKVDVCGSIMWVWHRKVRGTNGLTVVKHGKVLEDIPVNWRDHIKVVSGAHKRVVPDSAKQIGVDDEFETLISSKVRIDLDDSHKAVINQLEADGAVWWWDNDHHMLVTHTHDLAKVHAELGLKGIFKTNSSGSSDQNCFCFPMRGGAWSVRRYTPGVTEHESWTQDSAGWTVTYFNRSPDLSTVCKSYGAVEDPKGGYIFREAEVAIQALGVLGVSFEVGNPLRSRETKVFLSKDGRLVIEVKREGSDDASNMPGWLAKKDDWVRILNFRRQQPVEEESLDCDDTVRHLVTQSNEDYGWLLHSNGSWRREPFTHVKAVLASLGLNTKEVTDALGTAILKAWTAVNKPFQPEYPGGREWNIEAAQFAVAPSKGDVLLFKSWQMILDHCGAGLDDAVSQNAWCQANNILNGSEYLKCWIASLFQHPDQPLPYLFFYGPQNSGKSIFHESLSMLMTKGYKRADAALTNQSGFNGELEGGVVCVVEETDLRINKQAYNLIKDWVTAPEILIHPKRMTPYHIPNTTHWIQCANDINACPVFPGDTRITMCYVDSIDPMEMVIKKKLTARLLKEAPDFLAEVLSLDLPESNDRLNVPVINTYDKIILQDAQKSALEIFLEDYCEMEPGAYITLADFKEKFDQLMPPGDAIHWSKIKIGKSLPRDYPKGRLHSNNATAIGNIRWKTDAKPDMVSQSRLTVRLGLLEPA